jgi:uncharacterized membrane protein
MHRESNERIVIIALVALQLIGLLLVATLLLPLIGRWHGLDLQIYYIAALRLLRGELPYRDFPLEYPPLALLPFALPQLLAFGRRLNFLSYVWLFVIQNALFSTLIALALARIVALARPAYSYARVLGLYALLIAVCAPLAPWRYDLFPALLTILALLAVVTGRPALAGIWLGLGIAAKLYPLVLVPVVGAYYLAGRRYRALAGLLLGSIGATALVLVPYILLDPQGPLTFVRYHQLRGLQIESLPAGAIILAHVLGLTQAGMVFNYGALHLVSPLAEAVLGWVLPAAALAFGLVLASCLGHFMAERSAGDTIAIESLAAYMMAALLTFLATNKVLSPQYIIWLLPFAPLLRPWQAITALVIVTLTIVLFPFAYEQFLAMQPAPVLLLNVRNALIAGLLGWLLVMYRPSGAHVAGGHPVRA